MIAKCVAPSSVIVLTTNAPRGSRSREVEKVFSSLFNNGGRGDADLLKLRLVRHNVDGQFRDGKQRLPVLELSDRFAEGREIGLGHLDQPVIFGPGRKLALFEVRVAL